MFFSIPPVGQKDPELRKCFAVVVTLSEIDDLQGITRMGMKKLQCLFPTGIAGKTAEHNDTEQ